MSCCTRSLICMMCSAAVITIILTWVCVIIIQSLCINLDFSPKFSDPCHTLWHHVTHDRNKLLKLHSMKAPLNQDLVGLVCTDIKFVSQKSIIWPLMTLQSQNKMFLSLFPACFRVCYLWYLWQLHTAIMCSEAWRNYGIKLRHDD